MPLFGQPSVDKLKAKGDTAGLLETLQNSKDARARQDAASALGDGPDTRAIAPLIATLRDPDSDVVQAAIRALVKFGRDALQPLLAALGSADVGTRAGSAWALGQISEAFDDSAIKWRSTEMLIASLRDRDGLVREAAAVALARVADPRAMKPLRDALTDSNPVVRFASVFAIAEIGIAGTDTPIRLRAVRDLATALDDPHVAVRKAAAQAIGEVDIQLENSSLRDSMMARLGTALTDPEPGVCVAVADALGSIGDARAVGYLFAVLLNRGATGVVRQHCLDAIVRIGAPAADKLAAMLNDSQAVRDEAVTILDRLGWVPDNTPQGAAYWLSKGNWERCVEIGAPAAEILAGEIASDDYAHRVAAGQSLVAIGEAAVPSLLRLLVSEEFRVREHAADLLEEIGWNPSANEIGAAYWVTKGCWDKAIELGDSAVAPLLRSLREGDFATRQAAASALTVLRWQPVEEQDYVNFAVFAHRWNVCREIGGPATDALISTVLLHDDTTVKREAACVLRDLAHSDTLEDRYRERILAKYDQVIMPHCEGKDPGQNGTGS